MIAKNDLQVAYHDAGHAVMALRTELPPKHVETNAANAAGGAAYSRKVALREQNVLRARPLTTGADCGWAKRRIMTVLAGGLAQMIYCDSFGLQLQTDGWSRDFTRASLLDLTVKPGQDAGYLETLTAPTPAILQKKAWARVEVVPLDLVDLGHLSARQVRRAMMS